MLSLPFFSSVCLEERSGLRVRSTGRVGWGKEASRCSCTRSRWVCVSVCGCGCTGLFLTFYFFLLWFPHKEKEYIWEKKVEKPFSFPYNPSTNLLFVCLNFLASIKYSINLWWINVKKKAGKQDKWDKRDLVWRVPYSFGFFFFRIRIVSSLPHLLPLSILGEWFSSKETYKNQKYLNLVSFWAEKEWYKNVNFDGLKM